MLLKSRFGRLVALMGAVVAALALWNLFPQAPGGYSTDDQGVITFSGWWNDGGTAAYTWAITPGAQHGSGTWYLNSASQSTKLTPGTYTATLTVRTGRNVRTRATITTASGPVEKYTDPLKMAAGVTLVTQVTIT